MRRERKSVRERLKVAYINLLCRKKNSEITVTELVREADVSRVSYYRSFASFEEILDECIDDAIKLAVDILTPHILEDKKKAWKHFIINFMSSLKNNTLPIPLMLTENAPLILSKTNAKLSFFFEDKNISAEEKYMTSGNLALIAGVSGRWTRNGFRESLDEIIEITYKLVENNLNNY